ncbi:MAG: ABC transporter substrate-binding protein [Gammaproteobacteria bacterium]|nr:ABC transporter substrate-binding protein [Gammaproteobacteria bacterium]MCP5135540.1 ABC transporter substrate-binding protein [Gammaproteobacteria bacterium]
MTGWLRFLVLCLAWLGLSACEQPPADGLRFALASPVTTLDPRLETDAASSRINRLLYAPLVDFDERLQPVPALASWEMRSPTLYRFRLGERNRQFHHGQRLTAEDVKATYDFVLDAANASPHRGALTLIETIEVIDADTLDFHLNKADALFPGYLVIGIVPRDADAATLARVGIGSGPFAFESWPEDGRLRLRRVADGRIVEFVVVKDPTVRALKLLRGEVDMLQNDIPPELVAYLSAQTNVKVQRAPGSNFSYLGFNLDDPDTGKWAVRAAVAAAIDRQAIIEYVLAGAARPAQSLLPPSHWAGGRNLPEFRRDLTKARALLADAGYSADHPLKLVYKTSSDPFRVRLATLIQSQLAEAGIVVDLRSYDWGTFFGDIKAGRFQMYSLSWVGIKTPDIFRYVFRSDSTPPAGANRGRFLDPQVDALIDEAETESDLETRAHLYARLQARLLEQLPYVPLWYEDHVFVSRTGIEGYRLALDGNYDGLSEVNLQ